MRVLVVGAGAVGGVVAGVLTEAGRDLTVLVRPGAVADVLAADGLTLTDAAGTRRVPVRATTSLDGGDRFGVALLATQPGDLDAAAAAVADHLTDDGAFVVLSNGLCEERLARVYGVDRVLGGVVAWGASTDGPGAVVRTSGGTFQVGRLDGADDPRVQAVSDLLTPVAPAPVTDNLRGARWTKLAFNSAISTLGTLGGDRVGALIGHTFVRTLALDVLSEAVAVARAEQVRLAPLSGWVSLDAVSLDPAQRAATVSPARWLRHLALLAVGLRIRNLRSSMLRELERGRTPAVDHLNGEIVAAAARHGLSAPVNEAARQAVHALARGEATPGLDTLRDLHARTRAR
ncbi:MAG: 2-dehydropantoate 2-reductase [Alphaproteobacteria bacterium]|nr:2-dehydropantoate 2-reductase [Alphaproteobacteria bacterium]